MKKKTRKKKTNNKITLIMFVATLLLSIGFFIDGKDAFIGLVNAEMNLSISEVDTTYDNNDYIEVRNSNDTRWAWPTGSDYHITSTYSSGHPAIDIIPRNDLNAYAAYNGTVITNSYKWDNGNYLVIKTDDNKYLMYAHLHQKLVNEGSKVSKGQVVGIIGRTGYATGTHLHFAVWEGYPHKSKSINPYSMY